MNLKDYVKTVTFLFYYLINTLKSLNKCMQSKLILYIRKLQKLKTGQSDSLI